VRSMHLLPATRNQDSIIALIISREPEDQKFSSQ
jgi:hypothetical protein